MRRVSCVSSDLQRLVCAENSLDDTPQALAFQYALHPFGATSNDRQIGLRWLIGCGAALFPIAQCAERNVKPLGEFLLSQPSARRIIFACGVRFICFTSALLKGCASGSASAARSIALRVMG